MTQEMMVTFEIDKDVKISTVVDWMNEKILGSKVIEVSITNTDWLFCGALNTFLGECTIVSTEVVSIDELKHLFSPHPHFIHQLKFKIRS
ncbi:hypothetical protein [Pelosinus sp. IPA-1]|uniref:hypothetical protein n=1 Tax=Pelosinus sp. IPA-1 TaxID=3029569 RepID=UPI0024361834|nr:hypothetical protein [Pelosinus sp. IPA-1]GMA97293.1 hypothetical protein PIPA1_00930 [Pelosinus sp. IPA-1]